MILPPLIVRELRVALRKRGVNKSRFRAACTAGAFTAFFMLIGLTGDRSWGRSLHQWLFFLGLLYGAVRPAQFCLGLFRDERRSQMIELLSLTGLRPVDLFVGKALGGVLVASLDLLAIMPFLAVPFLSGGVSLELYLATVVALPMFLLFSVSVAILASVLCAEDGTAGVVTACIIGLLSLATPFPFWLGNVLTGRPPFADSWLWLSPGYGGLLIFRKFGSGGGASFWPTAGFTVMWTLVCLVVSVWVLRRKWRRVAESSNGAGLQFWERFIRGGETVRAQLRTQLLQINPFRWLVQRDRRPMLLAWVSIGGICGLWLIGWCAWPRYWPSPVNFFITAMLMVMIADGLQLHAAARPLCHSRQEGTLELLLTTALSPQQILDGELEGLQAQFRPVRLFLLGLFLLMIAGGFLTRTWNPQSVASYLSIWCIFLLWCMRSQRRTAPTAMWVALITGRPSYAVYRSQGSPWQWLWLFFNLRHLRSWASSAARFPSGSDAELIVVSLILMVVLLVVAFGWKKPAKIRETFIEEMRAIAQQPVPERDDPRFKQWKDVSQPFPATA